VTEKNHRKSIKDRKDAHLNKQEKGKDKKERRRTNHHRGHLLEIIPDGITDQIAGSGGEHAHPKETEEMTTTTEMMEEAMTRRTARTGTWIRTRTEGRGLTDESSPCPLPIPVEHLDSQEIRRSWLCSCETSRGRLGTQDYPTRKWSNTASFMWTEARDVTGNNCPHFPSRILDGGNSEGR
jgi:hypothetical protein